MAQIQREVRLPQPLIGRERLREGVVSTGAAARYRRLSKLIAATDVFAVALSMLVAYFVRFGIHPILPDFALVMVVAPVAWIAVFSSFRLYWVQQLAPAEEFRRVVAAVAVGTTVIMLASFWSRSSFSRIWVALTWILATVLVLTGRKLWHRVLRLLRADGQLAYRTLVVGNNEEAEHLAEVMRSPDLGFRVVGCLATGDRAFRLLDLDDPPAVGGISVIGHVDGVRDAIRETDADCLFVASSAVMPAEMSAVAHAGRLEDVEVRVSSNLREILSTRLSLQPFGGVMAMSLRPVRLSGLQAAAKRTFDLGISSLAVLLTLPLWLGIAVAIKLTSRGPVLFRQQRVGRHGRDFTLLKFRTMVRNAEAMLLDITDRNDASGPLFKIRDDPRVTAVGRWLRRWSIDELPQLVNVLRGEMSLVGPRPPLRREVAEYEDWHMGRLEVAPGITGLWQVSGRSDVSFNEYVRLDLFYIENWSISYDLFILAKTIPALLWKRGAY